MTHGGVTMRGLVLAGALVAFGCGPERLDAPVGDEAPLRELPPGDAELVFAADFSETATGPLVAGTSVRVRFAEERLPRCRGWKYGMPAWAITAHYRIDGGEVRTVPVVMHTVPDLEVWLDLDRPGVLEVWFSNNDAFGCNSWDSDFGANYRFDVLPGGGTIPAWMGEASWVSTRNTCGGTLCEGDLRPLDEGFRFDTAARQRALVALTTFRAWAPGITDTQQDRVWELFDARIHRAAAPGGEELGWDWVSVHDFPGNDVRYAYPLRRLDPLGGSTVTDPADCPEVPLRVSDDGLYVEADLYVWFSVNGAALQPEEGAWRGTFQDYRDLYEACL